MLAPLELELYRVANSMTWVWELKSGPLQEQHPPKPSPQPFGYNFYIDSYYLSNFEGVARKVDS